MPLCQCANAQMCQCANVQMCQCAKVPLGQCRCANVLMCQCQCANVQLCQCANVQMCRQGRQAGKQASKAGRQAGKARRQAGRPAGKQAGRAGRQVCTNVWCLSWRTLDPTSLPWGPCISLGQCAWICVCVHTKYVVQRWPQPPRGWPDARHARSIGIAAPCLIDRVYDMNNGLLLG